MIKLSELKPFDMAEHLEDKQAIAEYLTIVLEENNPQAFVNALGTVARATGMTHIAKEADINRESLYRSLGGGSIPRLDTLMQVLQVLGIQLVAQPIKTP